MRKVYETTGTVRASEVDTGASLARRAITYTVSLFDPEQECFVDYHFSLHNKPQIALNTQVKVTVEVADE